MKSKKATQQFNLAARITVEINTTISAKDIYEAIEIAKTMKAEDFIETSGDINDITLHGFSYISASSCDNEKQIKF